MPAAILGPLLTFLVSVFGQFAGRLAFRSTVIILAGSLVAAALIAFVAASLALVNSVQVVTPDIVLMVWGWIMPGNVYACFSVIFGVYVSRMAYDYYSKMMLLRAASA